MQVQVFEAQLPDGQLPAFDALSLGFAAEHAGVEHTARQGEALRHASSNARSASETASNYAVALQRRIALLQAYAAGIKSPDS